jgi:UDP-N-acetyl-D-glucosamine dehydrogenase
VHEHSKVIVVGQGYVGLPVAMRAVEVGFDVVGIDLDKRRIDDLVAGRSYIDDVGDDQVTAALASGRYLPSISYDAAAHFDVAVITVPTPLNEGLPDLTFIEQAAFELAPHLRAGSTVILESTTYPGTTDELLVPILEQGAHLRAGPDFHVGYSPERIDPGNQLYNFVTTPKVVSGTDESSLRHVQAFYDRLVERTVAVSGPKEAEMTKLLENTFRHVNIALVNELAVFAHDLDIDIWEAIDAASTKPFGYLRFTPGPGVGGHCLPIDPSYLSWQVKRRLGRSFRFVEVANDVNDHMPHHVVDRLIKMLNARGTALRNSRILLVGLAYKKDTGDIRQSPALKIIELLHEYGSVLVALDDHVEGHRWPDDVTRVGDLPAAMTGADAVVVLTAHSDVDHGPLAHSAVPVLDTQRVVTGPHVRLL